MAVLKAAIPAMQSALSVCERIHEAPWSIATDARGNLYEQVYNIVCDEQQGLRWAIADLSDILEDLDEGPNQGEWVASVFAVPPEAPKRSRRKPRAVERS